MAQSLCMNTGFSEIVIIAAISVNRTSYSDEFNSFDKNRNVGCLIYEGDSPISVIGYKPALDSMFMTPIVLDSANFFNIRFKLKTRNLTFLGGDDTQLIVVDSKLIVGYPSFSDILVYDLASRSHQVFISTSVFSLLKEFHPCVLERKKLI